MRVLAQIDNRQLQYLLSARVFNALSSASCIGVKGNRRDIRSHCDAHTSANWVGVKHKRQYCDSSCNAHTSANWVDVKPGFLCPQNV